MLPQVRGPNSPAFHPIPMWVFWSFQSNSSLISSLSGLLLSRDADLVMFRVLYHSSRHQEQYGIWSLRRVVRSTGLCNTCCLLFGGFRLWGMFYIVEYITRGYKSQKWKKSKSRYWFRHCGCATQPLYTFGGDRWTDHTYYIHSKSAMFASTSADKWGNIYNICLKFIADYWTLYEFSAGDMPVVIVRGSWKISLLNINLKDWLSILFQQSSLVEYG